MKKATGYKSLVTSINPQSKLPPVINTDHKNLTEDQYCF